MQSSKTLYKSQIKKLAQDAIVEQKKAAAEKRALAQKLKNTKVPKKKKKTKKNAIVKVDEDDQSDDDVIMINNSMLRIARNFNPNIILLAIKISYLGKIKYMNKDGLVRDGEPLVILNKLHNLQLKMNKTKSITTIKVT